MKKLWTEEDINYLNANYGTLDRHQLAIDLDRTPKSITHYINKLNLANMSPKWSDAEIDIIIQNHSVLTRLQLSKLLPRKKFASFVY